MSNAAASTALVMERIMKENAGKIFIYRILPKSMLSRFFGSITRVPMPGWFLRRFIRWYSGKYGVNTEEMLEPEGGFRTINRFFTRSLLPGARSMDVSPSSIVSPVDARVDQYGRINSNLLIQAKGIDYTLEGLIPSPMHAKFIDGDFITLYLSPGDYHRIHSPVSGLIYGYQHVPGKLFTVQDFMVRSFPDLFSVNERITSYIGTAAGFVAVCKVGATNVGRISLSYDSIITNKTFRSRKEVLYADQERKPVERGGELGTFNLGSTVVALFEKGMVKFEPLEIGSKVRMGQRIAVLAR